MINRTISSFIWRLAERCGAQGVSFIVTLIIARIISPEDYGTVAIVTVISNILQVFVDSGMGSALIQKKNADDLDFSTVFFFNCFMCLVVYLAIFFMAPLFAQIYKRPELTLYIRVFSINILISGIKNIQQAYVSKNLLFKKFFFSTLGGTIVSAGVGIIMAYKGLGCWALISQVLTNSIIDTTILWITVKWRPHLLFSFQRLKGLFHFGVKLLASSLIEALYSNLNSLLIGGLYSSSALAFYNKGYSFPSLVMQNINASIDSVLLPTMSNNQDDRTSVKNIMKKSLQISTYVLSPILIGLAVVAKPLVLLLLTDKWVQCVPYVRVFCIYFLLFPIHTTNLNAINSVGRSDVFLKLEIIKKLFGLGVIFVSAHFGPIVMAYGMLLLGVVSLIINSFPNKKFVDYSFNEQIKDILPNFVLSGIMGIFVYLVSLIPAPNLLLLLLQIIVGISVYVLGSIISKNKSFDYLFNMLKSIRDRRK